MAMQQVQRKVVKLQQCLYFARIIKTILNETLSINAYDFYYFTEQQAYIYKAIAHKKWKKKITVTCWNTGNFVPIHLFYEQLSSTNQYYTYQYKYED